MADLSELLAVRTKADEEQILLSVYQEQKLPTTDWFVGSAIRTITKALAKALLDHYNLVQLITRGRLVPLAAAIVDAAGKEVHGWLDQLGEGFYNEKRSPATSTVQRCVLTCTAGFGPIPINQGFTARAFPSGNRYIYQGGVTVNVADGGSVSIDLTAEEPGAKYADPAGSIFGPEAIVTPLPGLTIDNPAGSFGGLDLGGNAQKSITSQGTGTITPSASATPEERRSYVVTITGTGVAGTSGAMKVDYYQNGDLVGVGIASPIPTTYSAIGDSITLTLTGQFIAGDQHTFSVPGTPIYYQGVDVETNASYAAKLLAKWPSLAPINLRDKYLLMIDRASTEGGYGIEKATITPSNIEAGVATILVATATGAPPGGTITALQNYINARTGITDKINVVSASNDDIEIAGEVTVKASHLLTAQAVADEAWRKYVTELPIGGDISTGTPGVVRFMELVQALMDAGAIDVANLEINGFAGNYTLADDAVPVIPAGQEPSVALTWLTVP